LAFREALMRERERTEGGEDVGFFVKNVENVQGDERDVIVFSTTFGRNEHGVFRKSFGGMLAAAAPAAAAPAGSTADRGGRKACQSRGTDPSAPHQPGRGSPATDDPPERAAPNVRS
jgi:hypothetical protein